MKILIVSGFLGAGKTTFIKELIRRCRGFFVILENEYGNTAVDQQVLRQQDNADVWNLTEGCVCCTKSADMNASILTIESTLEPEFLIVEPSGIGALSNIIKNLKKMNYDRIQILSPITVIDANNFVQDYDQYGDVYQDQIRTAGTIVISQPENMDAETFCAVSRKVAEVNAAAKVLDVHYTKMDDAWWSSLLTTSYDGREIEVAERSSLDFESFAVKECKVDSPVALMWILQMVLYGAFGKIVRAKGILKAGSSWVRFDVAGGQYSIVGIDEEEEKDVKSECVFIGHAIERILLRQLMCKSRTIKPAIFRRSRG